MHIKMISINEAGFTGCLYQPEERIGIPLIVVAGSDGGLEHAQYVAKIFARKGLTALALAYFKYPGLNNTLSLIPLEYIEEAIAWLGEHTNTSSVAIYGISKGSEYALCAATRFSAVTKVVAVVPNYYVAEGKGKGMSRPGTSSWTYRGKALPYQPMPVNLFSFVRNSIKKREIRIATFYECAEKNGIVEQAIIPVENCNAKILLLSSLRDSIWPSKHAGEMIEQRLIDKQYSHVFQHISFEYGSHILDPITPEKARQLQKVMSVERQHKVECQAARNEAFDLAFEWIIC